AEPGEVLIGAATRRLVREAVEVGDERLLELKGKADPVAAYSLLEVVGERALPRLDLPIVGRERERHALSQAWQRALSESACHLFTVLGPAGGGKSRLAAASLRTLEGPRVVRGRVRSYGERITYRRVGGGL